MDKFTEKVIKKDLRDMGLIKAVADYKDSNIEDVGFYLVHQYRGLVYVDYTNLLVNYKDVSAEEFKQSVAKELKVARKNLKKFRKKNKKYKEGKKYKKSFVINFIRGEVYLLCDMLKIPFDKGEYDYSYKNEISKMLAEGKTPMQIYKKTLKKYKVKIKSSQDGYELLGLIEYEETGFEAEQV